MHDDQVHAGTRQEGDYRTPEEIDEELQERMRREAATREDLPDATDRVTEGGFGSGQGMELGNIGQDPDHPNERGYPRGKDPNWPA
jgi:hypothetical protein